MPRGQGWPSPGRRQLTIRFGEPLVPGADESVREFAPRIKDAVAALLDEDRTTWWEARRRAAAGADPTRPARRSPSGAGSGSSPSRPVADAPAPQAPRLAPLTASGESTLIGGSSVRSPLAGRVDLVARTPTRGTTMNTLLKTGTIGLASLVTAGVVAWQAPTALAKDDDPAATKRDDDSHVVVTTVDDDDDDDTGLKGTGTQTRTRGGDDQHEREHRHQHPDPRAATATTAATARSATSTSDGPGSGNVDHSRHHTNDGTRHNTRG